jgi:hypothetical protein
MRPLVLVWPSEPLWLLCASVFTCSVSREMKQAFGVSCAPGRVTKLIDSAALSL